MDSDQKVQLEEAGFEENTASNFFDLTTAEQVVVEMRVRLAEEIRIRREGQGLTQNELAEKYGTAQSRISDMENGAESVSLDALVAALAKLGADKDEIGRILLE